jgi:hypothetical protein
VTRRAPSCVVCCQEGQGLWCRACSRAYDRFRAKHFGPTEQDVIQWAAKRARDAERARRLHAASRWRGKAADE